ncbi:unnamed protein product [Protopolystoma xenopodis]|uniref:Secreted protein n=1 Tax=Protopolystoma xenopodis TaxID=117903 RepID=A0A3S5B7P1_9PLAT|nr:unnamed protein product [Protopolystoma xenopodis]
MVNLHTFSFLFFILPSDICVRKCACVYACVRVRFHAVVRITGQPTGQCAGFKKASRRLIPKPFVHRSTIGNWTDSSPTDGAQHILSEQRSSLSLHFCPRRRKFIARLDQASPQPAGLKFGPRLY